MATLAFRFFDVFGPRQAPGHADAAVAPAFVSAALTDEPLIVHGDGLQSGAVTDVGTVSEVLDAVRRRVRTPQPINLAFGTSTTLLEVIVRIELDWAGRIAHVDPRSGDDRHSQTSDDALRSLCPSVSPVSLDDGLASTIDWMRRHLT